MRPRMGMGIFVLAGVAVVTIVTWVITPTVTAAGTSRQIAQLFAALALAGFAAGFAISTRNRLVDRLFNGLDKAYVVHKVLAICSVALVILHVMMVGEGHEGRGPGGGEHHAPLAGLGGPSLFLFIVIVVLALFAKKLKYENWRLIHKVMIVPYVIGVAHYYGSSTYGALQPSAFSIWLTIANVIGLTSAVYSIFLAGRLGFRHKYVVTATRLVADKMMEITATTTGRPVKSRPGQFAFVVLNDKEFTPHPFTISGTPGPNTIQFTIKNLGDHTARLVDTVAPGDEIAISNAHGTFDYTRGTQQQIWIAGGIGITPFRAFYSAGVADNHEVDFFYAYHGEPEAAYLDELESLRADNLRVHLIDDTQVGFLNWDMIKARLADNWDGSSPRTNGTVPVRGHQGQTQRGGTTISEAPWNGGRGPFREGVLAFHQARPIDIYFCGPKPMREALRKSLPGSGIPVVGFHYEEFGFGR